MKRISLVALLCSLLVSFVLGANMPVQDVYHFDIREGLANLAKLTYEAPLQNAPGKTESTMVRNVGQNLVDLIELAVANNTDPSVSLGNPDANISNFGLADSGVYWDATAGITQFELAVMAVKILGREKKALELYPLMTPTFTDASPNEDLANYQAGKKELFYNRAYGYVEYYNNFLREEYPCLMSVPFETVLGNAQYPHLRQATRLDVIEFVVKLAQAKFNEEDYNFNDVFAYLPEDLLKALKLDQAEDKSLVAFAEALDKHLSNSAYTWNTTIGKVGYLYAFEFFFLSEVDAKEVSAEKNMANTFTSLEAPLNVPVLFLDEFRVYHSNGFHFLGRTNPTRNVWQDEKGNTLHAERFWTVALFSKLFNTDVEKIPEGAYAPKREFNNVVVYEKTGEDYKGQLRFGNIDFETGLTTNYSDKEEFKCENSAYPEYLDPDGNSNTPKLNYYVFELKDGSKVVLTDMTIWDKSGMSSTNGSDFYAYNPPASKETRRTYSAYGYFYEKEKRLIETKILDSRDTAPTTQEKALFPYTVDIVSESIDSYKVFIPTVEDFIAGSNNVLAKSVRDILQTPESADKRFVKAQNSVPVSNLVDAEPVMFDVTYTRERGETKFLYAMDRLNHEATVLTLDGVKAFIDKYTGDKVIDRIDALSDEYADQPMIAYYIHMYNTLKNEGLSGDTRFVAVVKTPETELSAPEFSNFRIAEQLFGEVNAVERYNPTDVKPLKEAYMAKGDVVARTSEYEVYPVITDSCVRPVSKVSLPDIDPASVSAENCCLYDLEKGDFVVAFDPYVQYDFAFSGETRLVALDGNNSKKGPATTMEESPEVLLENNFGFVGPKVKEVFITRSINPEKPTLSSDDAVLLKIYEGK